MPQDPKQPEPNDWESILRALQTPPTGEDEESPAPHAQAQGDEQDDELDALSAMALAARDLEKDARIAHLDLENEELAQTIRHRDVYADRLFALMVGTLVGAFFLLIWSGMPEAHRGNRLALSETVQVSIIAAVTLEVIGLFAIVTRHLFPPRDRCGDPRAS